MSFGRDLWPSGITHCSIFQIGLNEFPAYPLHLSLRVLKVKCEVLLVCLQCVKCCHPISLGTVSGSGIWVPLECPDLVDHVFQNSICKFRKLPHTVHHMAQPSLLRGTIVFEKSKTLTKFPNLPFFLYCHGFHGYISQLCVTS